MPIPLVPLPDFFLEFPMSFDLLHELSGIMGGLVALLMCAGSLIDMRDNTRDEKKYAKVALVWFAIFLVLVIFGFLPVAILLAGLSVVFGVWLIINLIRAIRIIISPGS